jgi:hypothetical protein
MTAFDLAQALLRQYPPNAVVHIGVPSWDDGYTEQYLGLERKPVTEILLDEERNTIELVAD